MEPTIPFYDYIEMAMRRKWWIIVTFVICIAFSCGLYKVLPKIYRATTVIFVVPPEVPEAYINPTVRSSASERLSTLRQQILSRTRLEMVIKELNLYADLMEKMPMEEIIEIMRKATQIEVRRTRGPDTFMISYVGKDPRNVMMVANRLASFFIEENIALRENLAVGTSEFLKLELSSIEAELKKKEDEIRLIKERHMGELPEQLGSNLSILKRLQDQLNNISQRRKAAEELRLLLQNQLSQVSGLELRPVEVDVSSEFVENRHLMNELDKLRERLGHLQVTYTDKHPDVVEVRTRIAKLEEEIQLQQKKDAALQEDSHRNADPQVQSPVFNPHVVQIEASLKEVESEIARLKVEKDKLEEQIAVYERRVENTPRREQEMAEVMRDLGQLRNRYNRLSDKKYQAKLAENLERRQKGEQFKIIDPAVMPEKPFKPSRKKILFFGAFFGLVLGCGLGYMKETLDRSFHKTEEVERLLGLPVIATIPRIENRKNWKQSNQPHIHKDPVEQMERDKEISTA
jgi:polysaccharide chain length determinant protein (PEP-CTERM system associated)